MGDERKMNETQLVYEQMRCKITELEQENTEEDLRKTFSNFKKFVDKMKGKKQSKE